MYASDESSPIQALPSQASDLMRAQGCCEGFCDDQNIAECNNPDVRSDLSKQEARKRPERALLLLLRFGHCADHIVDAIPCRMSPSGLGLCIHHCEQDVICHA